MSPRKGVNLKRRHPEDVEHDSEDGSSSKQPRLAPNPLPLRNGHGLILDNLQKQLEAEFKSEKFSLSKFSSTVFTQNATVPMAYKTTNQKTIYRTVHFQIYDWLRLDDEDRLRVLEGDPPVRGHFEKLSTESITQEHISDLNLTMKNDDGSINVRQLAKRLKSELLFNKFTKTQFAIRILGGDADGRLVKDIIENPQYCEHLEPIYQKIYDWCKMHIDEKQYAVNSLPSCREMIVRDNEFSDEELRKYLLDFIACPTSIEHYDPAFRRRMLAISMKSFQKMRKQQALADDSAMTNLDATKWLGIYLRNAIPEVFPGQYDNLIRNQLIPCAFTDGYLINYKKLAECIQYVLRSHGYSEKEFAEMWLRCSEEQFNEFLTSGKSSLKGIDQEQAKLIGMYLTKYHGERRKVWNMLKENAKNEKAAKMEKFTNVQGGRHLHY